MTDWLFLESAKEAILDWELKHLDCTDDITLKMSDIYVVWFCKTLQNAKGLFSTKIKDGMYFEVTYNGDKNEYYLDSYKKFDNKVYKSNFEISND